MRRDTKRHYCCRLYSRRAFPTTVHDRFQLILPSPGARLAQACEQSQALCLNLLGPLLYDGRCRTDSLRLPTLLDSMDRVGGMAGRGELPVVTPSSLSFFLNR